MVDDRVIIRAFMVRLVQAAGGVDGAAATISAATGGHCGKGTISKRMSGDLEWPLVDILALEKALGDPCVSRWLAQGVPEIAASASLMESVAHAAREHGEAIAAVMAVGLGGGDVATAQREVSEARSAMDLLSGVLAGVAK